jgi:hypothetical protein
VLVGMSGAGKSTFGRAHFRLTEVIFSDFCHGVVADDESRCDVGVDDRVLDPGDVEAGQVVVDQHVGLGRWIRH